VNDEVPPLVEVERTSLELSTAAPERL